LGDVVTPDLSRRRIQFFKETPDDWHPSYRVPDDVRFKDKTYVVVTLHENFTPEGGLHRVSVWGMDDTGMDVDYENWHEAVGTFTAISMLESISMKKLTELGFEPF
jgi:hypothetical protein